MSTAISKSDQIRKLLATGMDAGAIAKQVGCSRNLVYVVKSQRGGRRGKATRRAGTASATPSTGHRGRQVDPSSKSGKVRALLATGMSTADITKKVGCSANLVYFVRSTMGRSGGAPKRGQGRPRKAPASTSMNGLGDILAAVQGAERERAQLRAALEQIQNVLADVLA